MMEISPPDSIQRDIESALAEDLGSGDLTAALIPPDLAADATVLCRDHAVLCGKPWFEAVFAKLSGSVTVDWLAGEGDDMHPDMVVCKLHGPARALLSGERTALNFLQTLSGTATVTRRYAELVAETKCRILDTRKTIPGLRAAQKYATRIGGAVNHRHGLYDGILIKENHIIACGGIAAAVRSARRSGSEVAVEIEVEDLEEAAEALAAGADILLLDNFPLDDLGRAVAMNRSRKDPDGRPPAALEASGNITLEALPAVARTGVDFVSVGALTKHVAAVDYSMRFEFADA